LRTCRNNTICWWLLLGLGWTAPAGACDYYCLRDAAYDQQRDMHRLCVVARTADDPQAMVIHQQLGRWLETDARTMNLRLYYLAADDPELQWSDFGIPFTPDAGTPLPVTLLVGHQTVGARSWIIDSWLPGPTEAQLADLLNSPARDAIRREVGRRVAVFLYIPGSSPDLQAARRAYEAVASEWTPKERAGFAFVQFPFALVESLSGFVERGFHFLAFLQQFFAGPEFFVAFESF